MTVFECESYKEFILALVQTAGKRGLFKEIAQAIGANSSAVSQIFRGPLDLNLDQALALSEYLSLSSLERDYFLGLVQRERAGTAKLKKYLDVKLKEILKKAQQAQGYVSEHEELPERDQMEFYSDWTYSAIRLATSLSDLETSDALARHFDIPLQKVQRVLNFLVQKNLCRQDGDHYKIGVSKTHLSADSPMIARHHANWRLKAMENHPSLKEEEFAFSSPMTISWRDFSQVKKLLLATVQKTHEILRSTDNEVLACMNLDWFEVK